MSDKLKVNTIFDPYKSHLISMDDGADILGVVVLFNYSPPATIEMSIVTESPKWCTRKVLFHCFNYCFNIANVKRIYTQVKGDNRIALEMNRRLGFKEMAVLPDNVVTVDGEVSDNHIFSMTKNECKWL
jgi:RimJ/RimL family protein N-acetyltransferase